MGAVSRLRLLALAGLALGCATSHGLYASDHAARPIPSGSHSSGHSKSHSGGSHHGGDAALLADCLDILCSASLCAVDTAASSEPPPMRAENGDTYLDPPDPILVAAAQQPPAAEQPAPPPQVAPAVAAPAAPEAVLAVHPGEAGTAKELAEAISLAQDQLQRDERAAFVERFLSARDRAALQAQPGRDPVSELAGARSEQLLRELQACHTWGAELDGDEARCGTEEQRLRWHLEPQGWVIEGLLDGSK